MVQLPDRLFELSRIRRGNPLDALFGELQPHADGIQRLQEVIVKILAEPLTCFKGLPDRQFAAAQCFFCPFLLRNIGPDGDQTLLAV